MRILHISTRLILGGSQENTVLSCEGQAALGHDVHLAFGPIYGPEGSLLERVRAFRTPDGRGITTHVVPSLVRRVDPLEDPRAYRQLYELIKQIDPDIVHTHSSKAGVLGRAAAWAVAQQQWRSASGKRLAIVHTIHGPPFMPVDGSLFRRTLTRVSNWIYTRAERVAAKKCHAIVSVADAMTQQFLARGIGRPEMYTTVRSGMDTQTFVDASDERRREVVRAQLGFDRQDFVVGTVARLAQHKGHDDLLSALQADLARDPKLKLLWVGDGWWRERLVARARSMKLSVRTMGDAAGEISGDPKASIVLTGLVPPAEIPGLMSAMDVLAHPSFREGLPRTVPQALLAGACPVAYDCDGTGEVIDNEQTGMLVPTGNVQKLGEAIRWVRAHPAIRQQMVQRGREICADAFSVERMVSDLEAVYQVALAGANKSIGPERGNR